MDNNNAQPRVTSVCHQGRDDADDACDVDPEAVDPDAAGTIGDLEKSGRKRWFNDVFICFYMVCIEFNTIYLTMNQWDFVNI